MKKLAILLVVVVLLAACGGGSDPSTPSATSGAALATGTAMTTEAERTPATAANTVASTATPTRAVVAASATPSVATTPATRATVAATIVPTEPPAPTATSESVSVATQAPAESPTDVPAVAPTVAPTPAPTEAATPGQPSQEQLTGSLLAASDLPDGWSDVPPDPGSDAEPVGFCTPDAASGIDQRRASGAFQQPDQGYYLQETLIGFAAGGAEAWMDWVRPTVDCAQVTDDSVDPPVIYQVTPLDFSLMGDQMLAYRLSVSDPTLGEIAYDIVYTRVGNCVAAVANLALGTANSDLTQSATAAAVNRARPVCG